MQASVRVMRSMHRATSMQTPGAVEGRRGYEGVFRANAEVVDRMIPYAPRRERKMAEQSRRRAEWIARRQSSLSHLQHHLNISDNQNNDNDNQNNDNDNQNNDNDNQNIDNDNQNNSDESNVDIDKNVNMDISKDTSKNLMLSCLPSSTRRTSTAPMFPSTIPPRPSEPPAHPDPLVNYAVQVDYRRKLYAHEVTAREHVRRDELRKQQAAASSQAEQRAIELKRRREQRAYEENTLRALLILERATIKHINSQLRNQRTLARNERQKEDIVRLYHQADSFITIDSLDAAIDKCLATDAVHFNANASTLLKMAELARKEADETTLYDQANGTILRKDSVAKMQDKRKAELDALDQKRVALGVPPVQVRQITE